MQGYTDTDEVDSSSAPTELWRPKEPAQTRLWEFGRLIKHKYGVELNDYESLRQWSISHPNSFWTEVWHFTGVKASRPFLQVRDLALTRLIVISKQKSQAIEDGSPMFPRPPFFLDAWLNFAENLLYPACHPPEESIAVIAATEQSREQVTWKELRERVRQCTNGLKKIGIREGDRVVGYVGHHTTTLAAMLAATSLGAIWTAVSPDTGAPAVLDRLQQVAPKVLFCDNAVYYNGKTHEVWEKVVEITRQLPDLEAVIVFEAVPGHPLNLGRVKYAQMHADFLAAADQTTLLTFTQQPADYPIYILFSSGTTGKPKCIVHGAIGTLIEHKKEHDIQASMRPGDRFFYYTTTSWMMWHWHISGLASGATLVLYDGSPFRPLDPTTGTGELAMPRLIDELRITHFGTSAKYLSLLEQKGVRPREHGCTLSSLRTIFSTGSPLAPSTFDYVYAAFGPDLLLASITGGTDIVSVFAGAISALPVYRGEIQARGLGFALEAWDARGNDITTSGAAGDLVCTRPFPCQPVAFWGDGGAERYRTSYFDAFPGMWRHGDFVRFDPATGGVVMLGRSDGVLKPAGVRFGSAEIYNVLLANFPEVEDALCIGRRRKSDTDETVVLFLKMVEGHKLDADLISKVMVAIRSSLSARHVPGVVEECPEIPVTTNGKK